MAEKSEDLEREIDLLPTYYKVLLLKHQSIDLLLGEAHELLEKIRRIEALPSYQSLAKNVKRSEGDFPRDRQKMN